MSTFKIKYLILFTLFMTFDASRAEATCDISVWYDGRAAGRQGYDDLVKANRLEREFTDSYYRSSANRLEIKHTELLIEARKAAVRALDSYYQAVGIWKLLAAGCSGNNVSLARGNQLNDEKRISSAQEHLEVIDSHFINVMRSAATPGGLKILQLLSNEKILEFDRIRPDFGNMSLLGLTIARGAPDEASFLINAGANVNLLVEYKDSSRGTKETINYSDLAIKTFFRRYEGTVYQPEERAASARILVLMMQFGPIPKAETVARAEAAGALIPEVYTKAFGAVNADIEGNYAGTFQAQLFKNLTGVSTLAPFSNDYAYSERIYLYTGRDCTVSWVTEVITGKRGSKMERKYYGYSFDIRLLKVDSTEYSAPFSDSSLATMGFFLSGRRGDVALASDTDPKNMLTPQAIENHRYRTSSEMAQIRMSSYDWKYRGKTTIGLLKRLKEVCSP